MFNLKSAVIFFALLLILSMGFAQQPKNKGTYDPTAKIDEINNAVNKLPYLQLFLKQVQSNPKKYCNTSKELRDSVNDHTQIDLMTLSFSVFKDSKNKNLKKIEVETRKAYAVSMQMIFAGQFLNDRQRELELHIAKVQKLIAETGAFKLGS